MLSCLLFLPPLLGRSCNLPLLPTTAAIGDICIWAMGTVGSLQWPNQLKAALLAFLARQLMIFFSNSASFLLARGLHGLCSSVGLLWSLSCPTLRPLVIAGRLIINSLLICLITYNTTGDGSPFLPRCWKGFSQTSEKWPEAFVTFSSATCHSNRPRAPHAPRWPALAAPGPGHPPPNNRLFLVNKKFPRLNLTP